MKKFMLFVGGLIALVILFSTLGPMIVLGISAWLLYVIFKQFVKSNSTAGKIGWVIAGLVMLSIGLSNIYAVIGLGAVLALYLIVKNWKIETNRKKFKSVIGLNFFIYFEKRVAFFN